MIITLCYTHWWRYLFGPLHHRLLPDNVPSISHCYNIAPGWFDFRTTNKYQCTCTIFAVLRTARISFCTRPFGFFKFDQCLVRTYAPYSEAHLYLLPHAAASRCRCTLNSCASLSGISAHYSVLGRSARDFLVTLHITCRTLRRGRN